MAQTRRRSRATLALLGALALGAGAPAQTGPDPAGAEPEMHPGTRLGLRADALRARLPILPALVVVPDERSYLAALESWGLGAIFPVLIDDGSDTAERHVFRFARAFEPETVLLWEAPEGGDGGPVDERIDRFVRAFWTAREGQTLDERWRGLRFEPPGVIVASPAHPSRTAAAALSAARGQPIVWVDTPARSPGGRTNAATLRAIDGALREALDASGWAWAGLGDQIDALTICLETGGRLAPPGGEKGDLAITDRLGRHADGRRWAWAGHLFGSEADAAYRAMGSIFFGAAPDAEPPSAWFFDGYPAGEMPEAYAVARATPVAREFMSARAVAPGAAGPRAWRAEQAGGLDASWVHVNSSGQPTSFVLGSGTVFGNDVPELVRPAAVHFIHSFSAANVSGPSTIAGAWLGRGAVAYAGSVHEPTLGAFVPPEFFVRRLGGRLPFGAAVRTDGADPWKVQVIGDPLLTVAPPGAARPAGVAPELPGARAASDALPGALRERDFATAAFCLAAERRHADALRLARAAVDDEDRPLDADAASTLLWVAFVERDADTFERLYLMLDREQADDEHNRALLWQVGRPRVESGVASPLLVNLMRAHVRSASVVSDLRLLRAPLSSLYGRAVFDQLAEGWAERVKSPRTRGRIRGLVTE